MNLTRTQLSKKYGITDYAWKSRHDELIEYLKEYMDITETKSSTNRYTYEINGDIPESIPKIPRKSQRDEKEEDYSIYVRGHLPYDFQPYSKSFMARNAIEDFGRAKYSHSSSKYITQAFVGPAMNKYGEHDDESIWVDYRTYEPLTDEQMSSWMEILRKQRIGEKEAANAFYADAQGEDITDAKNRFQIARMIFLNQFGFIPVRVNQWRSKRKVEERAN